LLPELEKHYFVFTDGQIEVFGNQNIKVMYQEKLGWPLDTLFRFKMFLRIENDLRSMDYLYFFNANLVLQQTIGNEILPSEDEELVVVSHPGFFNKKRKKYTYETNAKSLAYIPKEEGNVYIAGGLNGGTTGAYLKMINTLSANIDNDYNRNIVALWHDESHINRYIIGRHVKILSPSFLYPEGWNIPFEKKILILDKKHYGGHKALRE
jgi:hypothetical protein